MRLDLFLAAAVATGLIATACGGDTPPQGTSAVPQQPGVATATLPPSTPTPSVTATLPPEASFSRPLAGTEERAAEEFRDLGWRRTDFTRRSVSLQDINTAQYIDGIPALNSPRYDPVADAARHLADNHPVLAVEVNGDARAYPLGQIIWHEIVNDTIGGVPVAVTYCPLCNTAIVFRRAAGELPLTFGVSGNLLNSDLIMYDRESYSWWQQATGMGIVGEFAGTRLEMLPAGIIAFGDFRMAYPEAQVLSLSTGYERSLGPLYGSNPYEGYDDPDSRPFLFSGRGDDRLPLMERVVGVMAQDGGVAYPHDLLTQRRVVHDTVDGQPIVVWWKPGTASALDLGYIEASRDVGATGVFSPVLGGRTLTFRAGEDGFTDQETASTWNVLGQAIAGPLAGEQLEQLVHADHFWFAWAAFYPQTRIFGQ